MDIMFDQLSLLHNRIITDKFVVESVTSR